MDSYFWSRGGKFWCGVTVLALQGLVSAALAQSVCADPPVAAIKSGVKALSVLDGSGYRMRGVRWDPVLQQNWATIVCREHPEWPGLSLRVGETNMNLASRGSPTRIQNENFSNVPIVHAGDVVRLWWQEDLVRIEVTGVAEESGGLGKAIRVRLLRRNTPEQSIEEEFIGIVRGASDVERRR